MEPKTQKTEQKWRRVYYVEVKEVISRTYQVVAHSGAEALRIMNDDEYELRQETHVQWEFDLDRGYNLCEVDGGYQWHKTYAPTVDHVEWQVTNDEGEFVRAEDVYGGEE